MKPQHLCAAAALLAAAHAVAFIIVSAPLLSLVAWGVAAIWFAAAVWAWRASKLT